MGISGVNDGGVPNGYHQVKIKFTDSNSGQEYDRTMFVQAGINIGLGRTGNSNKTQKYTIGPDGKIYHIKNGKPTKVDVINMTSGQYGELGAMARQSHEFSSDDYVLSENDIREYAKNKNNINYTINNIQYRLDENVPGRKSEYASGYGFDNGKFWIQTENGSGYPTNYASVFTLNTKPDAVRIKVPKNK